MLEIPKDVTGGGKVDLDIEVAAPQEIVWRVFTDVERWPQYSDMYEFVRWQTSERWRLGTSFEGRMLWPFPLTMRYVIMDYRAPHEVRWLVHAIGIVIERWTRFIPLGANRTEIVTSAIFIGKSTEEIPGEVGDLLPQYTQRLYADFKRAAEAEALKLKKPGA